MKAGLLATAGAFALLVPAASAVLRVNAVEPVPVPADNGTPACADARRFLQQVNADLARFNKDLADAVARERQVEATVLALPYNSVAQQRAHRELSAVRAEVARLVREGKRIQDQVRQLGATASAECMTTEPTPSETIAEDAVPADNGTKECADDRNQMISLLRFIERLRANEAFKEAGPLGLSDVARRQIETQIKRLIVQLEGIAPKAAAACVKIDFTGTWTGTYTEAPSEGCAGKTGPTTLTLTQTGSELSGTLTDYGYDLCPNVVDLTGTVTGTVTGNTASIQTVYGNDAGTYRGTLTLTGKTLTFEEESGDSATFTRG